MPRAVKDHGGITSDEWCSPPIVTVPLEQFWGKAGGDPCSNDRSVVAAHKRYTCGGLIRPWWKTTYANWPYSQNDDWSKKAVYEMDQAKRVAELVILCMTATSTYWWRRLMVGTKKNPRVLLTKRIPFLGPGGLPVDSSRFEPALIYYGSRSSAFDKHFRHLTRWSTWGRSARA
jgi:hypothetical protein